MAKTLRREAFLGGLVLGSVAGAGLALVVAPAPGAETRNRLREQGLVLKSRAEDVAGRIVRRDAGETPVEVPIAAELAPVAPLPAS